MNAKLKRLMPARLLNAARHQKRKYNIKKDFKYDYLQFIKFSTTQGDLQNKSHIQAFLFKEYHAVEKGLALPSPKPGFGEERIKYLVEVLENYISTYGEDQYSQSTLAALEEYIEFNNPILEIENGAINAILKLKSNIKPHGKFRNYGGTKSVKKKEILSKINFDFSGFFRSRFSARDFSTEPVDTKKIMEAIDDARFSPSVCNRQAWKVFVVEAENKDLKRKLLNLQNGNRGFGENISSLLVITGKLSSFFEFERNQAYIDGGLFSMSLLLALHAKGLGTCCLNTAFTADKLKNFKKVAPVDEDCVPIMYIAVGNLKEEYKVAISKRKPVDEVMKILK